MVIMEKINKYNKELVEKFLRKEISMLETRELLDSLHDTESWEDVYADNWERANGVIADPYDKRIWNHISAATKPARVIPFRRIWAVSSVSLLCLFLGIIVYQWNEQRVLTKYADIEITVPRGQRNEVILPDGTHVLLNAESSLKYGKHFNGRKRHVEFSGEAFFSVAKDPDAPFVVSMGDVSVTALGTSFNLKSYPSDQEIVSYLKEGKILVKSEAESIELLYPNQCVSYNRTTRKMQKNLVENEDVFISWCNRCLTLEDEPLENIVKTLERQYNIKIEITNETLKSQCFNGTVENYNLTNVLEFFALASNLRYKYEDGKLILY